jgi:hypothetical protein
LQLAFSIGAGFAGDTVQNTVSCDVDLQNCVLSGERSLYDKADVYIPYTLYDLPTAYDLELNKYHGICTSPGSCSSAQATYDSGDDVYYTLEIKNNPIPGADPIVDNIAFLDYFNSTDLEFIDVQSAPALV